MPDTKKHFYHSVFSMESLQIRLDLSGFSIDEKKRLMDLAERTLHHTILDLVLSELSDKDKILFLHHHAAEKHDEIWDLLKSRIDNIEDKIQHTATTLSKKLHEDLKLSKLKA